MADITIIIAAAFTAAWKAIEHLETGQSFLEQRRAAGFDKRVVKQARRALESHDGLKGRAAARLLGDPTFAAFAADPDDPARQRALSNRVKVGEGLQGLIGPGVDEKEVFTVLARAWVAAAVADAKPVEVLLAAKQGVTNDTLLAIIDLALDTRTKQDAAAREIEEILARLQSDPSDLLVRDPFLAQDIDLAGAFTMRSELTGDDVPPYVARDVDPRLDQLLANADAGTTARFVAVAGRTKSGKTRCLLEALRRVTPLHLVYTVRRSPGRDAIAALITELAAHPPQQRWIVLVDDLYPHLADGAALVAATRKAAAIDPPGLIVATTTAATLALTKTDRLTTGINDNDIELIDLQNVELPRQATPAEQARARATLGEALAQAGDTGTGLVHFPERLAAIPQLRARLGQALGDPYASHHLALMLAAVQCALARGDRVLPAADLRDLAKCIHRHLDVHERHVSRLTDDALDDAETWATTRVGAAYALLTPTFGTDDHLEVLDDAIDQIGHHAISPRFKTCATNITDATSLGAAAYVRFNDRAAALQWTKPAANAGHTGAMAILGALLQDRGGEGDLAEAENWYRSAANAGHTDAMANLGLLHHRRGGGGDLAEAEYWYRSAANAGHTDAMANLGVLLQERRAEGDLAQAENWYRSAANAGHTGAMANLGLLLQERGGEGDLAQAENWYRSAANAGHIEAMAKLGVLLDQREGEGDLAEAEYWYRSAANAGHIGAMCILAVLLQERGGEGDLAQAEEWWSRAAGSGDLRVASYAHRALATIRQNLGPQDA